VSVDFFDFSDVQAAIDDVGSPVILRRLSGPQQIKFDVRTNAVISGFAPDELVGGIIQEDRRVIIGPRDIQARQWPAPPRKGDKVLIGDVETTVLASETVDVRGQIVRYNLVVRGGEG
jgi:hypothetical protein